jgi:hypothetical protein
MRTRPTWGRRAKDKSDSPPKQALQQTAGPCWSCSTGPPRRSIAPNLALHLTGGAYRLSRYVAPRAPPGR